MVPPVPARRRVRVLSCLLFLVSLLMVAIAVIAAIYVSSTVNAVRCEGVAPLALSTFRARCGGLGLVAVVDCSGTCCNRQLSFMQSSYYSVTTWRGRSARGHDRCANTTGGFWCCSPCWQVADLADTPRAVSDSITPVLSHLSTLNTNLVAVQANATTMSHEAVFVVSGYGWPLQEQAFPLPQPHTPPPPPTTHPPPSRFPCSCVVARVDAPRT